MEESRLKAATEGKVRYEGSPCRVCGHTERFVSNGNCTACAAEHTRKYREKIKTALNQARENA